MQSNHFSTYSKELEQFLFMHDIRAVTCEKDQDGVPHWFYERSPYLVSVVSEFRQIIAKRAQNRRA